MARLRSTNTTNLLTNNGAAHNFRFIGIEFYSDYATTSVNYNIIRLGGGANNIIFDRVYIHGHPQGNTFDGISAVGVSNIAVIDSYISEIHVAQGQAESHGMQLIGVTTAKIENNFISAAGENILIGDNFDAGAITSDVTIRGNHLYKPLSWKDPIPSGPNAGLTWRVKNLMEFKEANRVLVEGNVLENSWPHLQMGYGLVVTPVANPVSDLTFRANVMKNIHRAMQINPAYGPPLTDILFEDNIIYDLAQWLASAGGGSVNWTFRHNTVIAAAGEGPFFFENGGPGDPAADHFVVYDNILRVESVAGATGQPINLPAIQHATDNYDWNNNLLVDVWNPPLATDSMFRGFLYEDNVAGVGFTNSSLDDITDFRLSATSPYKNAGSDGRDLGANIDAILAAMGGQAVGAQALLSESASLGPLAADNLGGLIVAPPESGFSHDSRLGLTLRAAPAFPTSMANGDDNLLEVVASLRTESRDTFASTNLNIDDVTDEGGTQNALIGAAIADKLFSDDWDILYHSLP
jgi:hypothetical protein